MQHVKHHNMKQDVGLGHLLHPVRRKGVDQSSQDRRSSHNADNCASRRKVREIRAHRYGGQQELSGSIFRGSDSGDLKTSP